MRQPPMNYFQILITVIASMSLLLASCSTEKAAHEDGGGQARLLTGTWLLKSRFIKGNWTPAIQRQIKLDMTDRGTFTACYRGDGNQAWIVAGAGAFDYDPPNLTFFWDSGQLVRLVVLERNAKRIVIHHGPNFAPLKDQEPDELFVVRKAASKSPDKPSCPRFPNT